MEHFLGYSMMVLVICALCLLNWWKTKPTAAAADRFCLLFWEARDYAISAPSLDPGDRQSEAVRAAIARGAGETMAQYDRQLESELRILFKSLGTSRHLKVHYFDYLNNLFTIHKLFLRFCAAPDASLSQEEWEGLDRYMGDRDRLAALLSKCMTVAGRRALDGQTAQQPQPRQKEGIG